MSQNELHGLSEFRDKNGNLLAKCSYHHGKKEGKCLQYFPDGTVFSIQFFRKGRPNGVQKYFYPNEQTKSSLPYKYGKLHGMVILYNEDGSEKRRIEFNKGVML